MSIADVKKPVEREESPRRSANLEISWHTPEYIYYKKSPDWFWIVGIIALVLLVGAYFTKNVLFAFLIIIGGISFALYGARRPKRISVTVSGQGIQIDNRLFPYETLQSFWIFYRPGGIKELSITSQKLFMTHIKIPLGDQDPNEIREFLIQFLTEKAEKESLIDTIAHIIRY